MNNKNQKGFTLIEILVVIGIIAVLATIVLIAINPGRQFAQARNSQRSSNTNAILNAIGQNMADNKGVFACSASIPTLNPVPSPLTSSTGARIANTGGGSTADLRSCIVPTYISEIPTDPSIGQTWNGSTYDTGYNVFRNSSGRITVFAPSSDLGQIIEVTR
jgi:prepilin-type N-terminal cleavage/methylation domain-containing protein